MPKKSANGGYDVESLDLAEAAREAALVLQAQFPQVVFTSGRRTRGQQAAAMAQNIVRSHKRNWIAKAYKPSHVRDVCQKWVDDNPDATTAAQLMGGLLITLHALSSKEVGQFSRHLVGLAFDVRPVGKAAGAAEIKHAIRELPGLVKFIESEAGVKVWHAQFE
jgi:hypothetical protein